MTDLITADLVSLDEPLGSNKLEVIGALAKLVVQCGRATDLQGLLADAEARESKTATGIPGGIAIPHCRSESVTTASLAMARLPEGIEWGSADGPADLVFLIAAPAGADKEHLVLLSRLARALIRKDFLAALRSADSPQGIVELVQGAVSEDPADSPAGANATPSPGAKPPSSTDSSANGSTSPTHTPLIVGVTSCPTGIAHTYMAADALKNAAAEAGVEMQVETQGSAGMKPLDPDLIKRADAVIFAADVDVRDVGRFAGKPVITAPVKRGVDDPAGMIREALAAIDDPHANRVRKDAEAAATQTPAQGKESIGQQFKKWLLTGVSYMIPFVAGGGLLIALSFLLGGADIGNADVAKLMVFGDPGKGVDPSSLFDLPPGGLLQYLAAVLNVIGGASMAFLVPALAGFVAYGIADRPGIAVGFVVGAVSVSIGAGFLGGLIGGLLGGLVARWIGTWHVPSWLRGLMPVVIIPLLGSIITSGFMILLLGRPIASLMTALMDWLNSMSGTSAWIVGLIVGLMMCFDLGGPLNKVAYSFGVASIGTMAAGTGSPIMAAAMGAGMVPPLGMALASTVLARRSFTKVEQENGKAAWLLGLSFISEGAIPFAATDPLRVIPASMIGGGVTGALSMIFGAASQAPHGGAFVFFAITHAVLWFLAIIIGMVITAVSVVAFKRIGVKKAPQNAPVTAGTQA